jgi:hypothetical protein
MSTETRGSEWKTIAAAFVGCLVGISLSWVEYSRELTRCHTDARIAQIERDTEKTEKMAAHQDFENCLHERQSEDAERRCEDRFGEDSSGVPTSRTPLEVELDIERCVMVAKLEMAGFDAGAKP